MKVIDTKPAMKVNEFKPHIVTGTRAIEKMPLPLGLAGREIFGGPYALCPSGYFGVKLASDVGNRCDVTLFIKDYSVPQVPYEYVEQVVITIIEKLANREPVYVGCKAGIGRTGLVLALVAKALGVEDPVAYVREKYNPKAVETMLQHKYVDLFDVGLIRWEVRKLRVRAALVDIGHRFGWA